MSNKKSSTKALNAISWKKSQSLNSISRVIIVGEGRDEFGKRYFKFCVRGSHVNIPPISVDKLVNDLKVLFAALTNAGWNVTSGELTTPEEDNLIDAPNGRAALMLPRSRVVTRPVTVPRSLRLINREVIADTPEARLRRRLGKVCDAWKQFQASRTRDAVYPYLAAIAAIVEHYKARRKTSRLLRHAFKFAGLPFDENADPFTAIIRCTCEGEVDSKTTSKWSRALRYVAYCDVPSASLKTFMKEAGGINASAARFARYYGRGSR